MLVNGSITSDYSGVWVKGPITTKISSTPAVKIGGDVTGAGDGIEVVGSITANNGIGISVTNDITSEEIGILIEGNINTTNDDGIKVSGVITTSS